ncbi:MAG: RNA polymerase sigma factor [Planctomycetes bacterium]|nr:RNA polymerase sigma factor [Planctomycetota bacterium]
MSLDVPSNDTELVRNAQKGDRGAFEELVRRTSRLVHARVCLESGDPQRAEDFVQETYLRAWRSLRDVADGRGFRPWLLSIAQNVCIDAYRRDHRQRRSAPSRADSEALNLVPHPSRSPYEELARSELRDRVLAILRSLPDEYRMPLTLRYLGGADYETIRLQLGLTDGSLRGLLNRGLQLLRAELKRALGPQVAGGAP